MSLMKKINQRARVARSRFVAELYACKDDERAKAAYRRLIADLLLYRKSEDWWVANAKLELARWLARGTAEEADESQRLIDLLEPQLKALGCDAEPTIEWARMLLIRAMLAERKEDWTAAEKLSRASHRMLFDAKVSITNDNVLAVELLARSLRKLGRNDDAEYFEVTAIGLRSMLIAICRTPRI
jgi:hypothetical protein